MANNTNTSTAREQAFALLAAAKTHSNLAVKLSSLKQAKDILLTVEPSQAAEFYPYLVELQHSPEFLVRISLLGIIEEIGLKALTHGSLLVPILLAFLRDDNPKVASQSIVTGTNLFSSVLEEMAMQFYQHGKVERWLEELWIWMIRFKDAVFAIALEPGSVGTKLLALKFLETLVILFTPGDSDKRSTEGSRQAFNISWLDGGHPVLNPVVLISEAHRIVGILLDLLQSANNLSGTITISVLNCLTAIARKRPVHYGSILSALLGFESNLEMVKGRHTPSIQYSLRTAFLGFLRCTDSVILESRDRLLKALRAMNAGDAADQVLRQVDKMIRNAERALRDARLGKEDQTCTQIPSVGDLSKKRYMPPGNEGLTNGHEVPFKRVRHDRDVQSVSLVNENDPCQDHVSVNGVSPDVPMLDNDLTPAEQMIAMIGALLAEGERGIESLELLISQFPPDLLADIVITNMKNLPKEPPLITRTENLPESQQKSTLSSAVEVTASSITMSSAFESQPSVSAVTAPGASMPDQLAASNFPGDPKRDPRRDPRRLDPRRVAVSGGIPHTSTLETSSMQSEDIVLGSSKLLPSSLGFDEIPSPPMLSNIKYDNKILESPKVSLAEHVTTKEDVMDGTAVSVPNSENEEISEYPPMTASTMEEDSKAVKSSDNNVTTDVDVSDSHDSDEHPPATSDETSEEITGPELPLVPAFVELTEDHLRNVRVSAFDRIVKSYRHLSRANCSEMSMALLARLVSQIDTDDSLLTILQNHLAVDYQKQKGHELVLDVLYHLYALWTSDVAGDISVSLVKYEKFLLAVVKSLLDSFPASDKSFSRLLGEVPYLPDSTLKLLDDLCSADVIDTSGRVVRDVERVTQGLGAVWSLILGRPNSREACLSVALKCAIHPQDDVRAKAIRLVANKLYLLNFTSERVEEFATSKLMSAVNQRVTEDSAHCASVMQRSEGEDERLETSISGSQYVEQGTARSDSNDAQPNLQSMPNITVTEAQQLISLFFALCTKKPNLIRLVFNIYSKAPKTVKQAIHRHIPVVVRAIGSSCAEFLSIVSDLPEGSENLLMLVLQILTEDGKPSPELIATVKHLYETKLKDATILIPMLSSLSKIEVLPIFPRLVDLPPEKFQRALANILQGSAHTGPALTPAEVLVAIHGISPEKDGLPLKKITDVCSACFEQRTVFTQQVLAKALNQMIDQTPLPLLFMRTVIQAIDAFPTLVDFVMEILSKLVSRQVWRMPKLWVGFLKCASQTQPHSFPVLLQLPAPQLESTLNKHAKLRGPLIAYANQPSIRTSLPRQTLSILGLANESSVQQPNIGSSLHQLDTGSLHRAPST